MDTEKCTNCDQTLEQGYTLCWQCGTCSHRALSEQAMMNENGSPSNASMLVTNRNLDCLRCKRPMRALRRLESPKEFLLMTALPSEVDKFSAERQVFDMYVCAGCGKTELFLVIV